MDLELWHFKVAVAFLQNLTLYVKFKGNQVKWKFYDAIYNLIFCINAVLMISIHQTISSFGITNLRAD